MLQGTTILLTLSHDVDFNLFVIYCCWKNYMEVTHSSLSASTQSNFTTDIHLAPSDFMHGFLNLYNKSTHFFSQQSFLPNLPLTEIPNYSSFTSSSELSITSSSARTNPNTFLSSLQATDDLSCLVASAFQHSQLSTIWTYPFSSLVLHPQKHLPSFLHYSHQLPTLFNKVFLLFLFKTLTLFSHDTSVDISLSSSQVS